MRLYSALSLVSQLGPVKSESIKAWSIKSFSLYLFVVTEQNRTEQKRTDRDTRQSGDGTEVLYSCLCTTGIVRHRARKQPELRRKIPHVKIEREE